MRVRLTIAFVILASWCRAGHLENAAQISQKLRALSQSENKGEPSILPLMNELKIEVRKWLVEQLAAASANANYEGIGAAIHSALSKAGLSGSEAGFGSILGAKVSAIPGEPGLLQVTVSYDAHCSPDDSVMLFERKSGRWTLILNFDNEAGLAEGDRALLYAGVSPRNKLGRFYFLVVRTRSYCPESASTWNDVNYHVLRPAVDPLKPTLLLTSRHGYQETMDCRIKLDADSFTIDLPYLEQTTAGGRRHILQYSVIADRVQRVQPVAVTADEFVDEWLERPWTEAQAWSSLANRASLAKWHATQPRRFLGFPDQQFCSADRKLRQIRFAEAAQGKPVLFLVREISPHTFEMVSAGTQSAVRCGAPEPLENRGQPLLPESFNRRGEHDR